MKTWHIRTYCSINIPEINPEKVLSVVSVSLVMNCDDVPSEIVVGGLLKMIAPGLDPMISEIDELPYHAPLD